MSSSDSATFGVNKTVRHTLTPAGRIQRLTAAILVNDFQDRKLVKGGMVAVPRKPTEAQLQQLQQLAQSVLGADSKRGDVVTVQNMSFSGGAEQEAPVSVADKLRRGITQNAGIARYTAMLLLFVLVWALMFRPIQNQLLASMKEVGPANSAPPLLSPAAATPAASLEAVSVTSSPVTGDETEATATRRKLNELIQSEPAAMTRTLQAWLREDTA